MELEQCELTLHASALDAVSTHISQRIVWTYQAGQLGKHEISRHHVSWRSGGEYIVLFVSHSMRDIGVGTSAQQGAYALPERYCKVIRFGRSVLSSGCGLSEPLPWYLRQTPKL